MKSILTLAIACIFSVTAFAQETETKTIPKVAIEDISKYVGQKVTVCSKVFGAKFLDRSKTQPTFLNVGAAYPNSPLTVVIFGTERANFKPTPEELYNGKNICVTGEIKEFKGKYEIVISKPEEITVVE